MPVQVYQVTVHGTNAGQVFNNVFHFKDTSDDPLTAADMHTWAQSFQLSYRNTLSNQATLQQITMREVWPQYRDPIVIFSGPNPGTVASPSMPTFVSAVLQIRTGFSARTRRGRLFLPAVPESHTDGNYLAAGDGISTRNTVGTSLMALNTSAPAGHEFVMGVWSRKGVNIGNLGAGAFTGASQIRVANLLATQRRRKIGRGV